MLGVHFAHLSSKDEYLDLEAGVKLGGRKRCLRLEAGFTLVN
jgi:hypothetical protein